jgi:hypothetical protein
MAKGIGIFLQVFVANAPEGRYIFLFKGNNALCVKAHTKNYKTCNNIKT